MKLAKTCTIMSIAAMTALASAQTQQPATAPDNGQSAPAGQVSPAVEGMPAVQGTVANPRDADTPASAAGTLNEADRTFVTQAGISGLFEVQSSQLATTASQNQAVVSFARQMINDHTAANQQLMQLAAQKRVSVPQNLDAKHSEKLSKLASKQGEEFDKAYGKAQVKAHQEAINLFQRAAQNAQDPELKQFAEQTLPKLQQHLQQAQQLPGADQADKQKDHRKADQTPAPATTNTNP